MGKVGSAESVTALESDGGAEEGGRGAERAVEEGEEGAGEVGRGVCGLCVRTR